jgi:hypothetical protein
MKTWLLLAAASAALTACAKTEAIRTSGNTFTIQASAAPACGATGAARVASSMAAVETIRAGFDSYIIAGGMAANNVTVVQTPGQYQTSGTLTYGSGYGTYNGQTTYTPGIPMQVGTHDQALSVRMFRKGEPGSENAIDAREILGPDWQDKVKNGVNTCLK